MNEERLSTEEFVETGSNKISHILCRAEDQNIYKWALKFLCSAARGFGNVQHEPWIGPLHLRECSEVILLNSKTFLQKLDLNVASLDSTLRLIFKSSLHVDDFVSELVIFILDKNVSSEEIIADVFVQERLMSLNNQIPVNKLLAETSATIDCDCSRLCLKLLPCGTVVQLNSEKSNKERRKLYCSPLQVNNSEVKDLVNSIWEWVRNGRIKLTSDIHVKLLSHLPERVEEAMIGMAFEVVKKNFTRKNLVGDVQKGSKDKKARKSLYKEVYIVSSVLQDHILFIEAAASSSKLFQMCSSILNQLLIQSAGHKDAWFPMLSLCSAFAKETAKRRSSYYPLPVQTAVVLMELEPEDNIYSEKYKEVIHNHLKSIWRTVPPDATVALMSHFPEWLSCMEPCSLLCSP